MRFTKRDVILQSVLFATLIGFTGATNGQEATFTLLGKSQPDEFYNGIGNPYIALGKEKPRHVGQPKVNQDYVWSMATDGTNIWFGTGANVAAQATALVVSGAGGTPEPEEFVSEGGILYRVWEFGATRYRGVKRIYRSALGDARPPKVFQFNAQTNQLIDRTPTDRNIERVIGLRAAGVHNGVALLSGQSDNAIGNYFFAFDAVTGQYLGSKYYVNYDQIRRMIVADGQLYIGVLNTFATSSPGAVLRWTGSRANPFSFESVANLDNAVAYLAYHEGRLFAGTWRAITLLSAGGGQADLPPCGIWMSPPLNGGLTSSDAGSWEKVWDPTFYEIEPGAVGGYAIGAMESFGGSLYFGTLHFPGQGALAFQQTYGVLPPSPSYLAERTPIIVRAQGYGGSDPPEVELVYGSTTLPRYDGIGSWIYEPNATGMPAVHGSAGFGNRSNLYIWSSAVHNNQLYFGTFDLSGLYFVGSYLDNPTGSGTTGIGADLWSFPSEGAAAVAQSRSGCGNPTSHGVRNMVSTQYGLFLGMANSQNLLTDLADNLPEGGWELLKLGAPVSASGVAAESSLTDAELNALLELFPPSMQQLD